MNNDATFNYRYCEDPEPAGIEIGEAEAEVKARLMPDVLLRLDGPDFQANLLQHLRNRETPRLFFGPGNPGRIAALARELDPDAWAWERRTADEATAGRFYGASNPCCERFIQVDRDTFDFSSYPHPDPETIHGLNRHRWFVALGRHYWDDGERRYFDTLMDHWDFFCRKVPFPDESWYASLHAVGPLNMPPPFGELDIFIRLTSWWWAYWCILHAPEITPERNLVLLARCLRHFDMVAARGIHRQESNKTAMQQEALFLWATALPEIRGMRVWSHAARNNLENSLGKAVLADGAHWEMALSYHAGCIKWYGASYLLAERNGVPFATEYGRRLLEMGKYLDALVLPDGAEPCLGDSDRLAGWRAQLSLLMGIFPEARFRHAPSPSLSSLWISGGQTWDPAARTAGDASQPFAGTFPCAGVGVAATGSPLKGTVCILDNGPNHGYHAHDDNLSVQYEAFGKPVLVDPGRWIYDRSERRAWVCGASSHNRPWIDDAADRIGLPHIVRMDDRIATAPVVSIDGALAHLSAVLHGLNGYPDATAARSCWIHLDESRPWLVVLDRFDGAHERSWVDSWLLPAEQPGVAAGDCIDLNLDGALCVRVLSAADHPIDRTDDEGFWCPQYAEARPARWLRFCGSCATGLRAFAFVPYTGEPPELMLQITGGKVCYRRDGKEFNLENVNE